MRKTGPGGKADYERSGVVFRICVVLCAAAPLPFSCDGEPPPPLNPVGKLITCLKQMDMQAADFHSLTADMERNQGTVV